MSRRLLDAETSDANRLAQHASGYRPMERIMALKLTADDWRKEIIDYLKDPSNKVNRKIRFQAIKYVLLEEDLYLICREKFNRSVLY